MYCTQAGSRVCVLIIGFSFRARKDASEIFRPGGSRKEGGEGVAEKHADVINELHGARAKRVARREKKCVKQINKEQAASGLF